ncbi:hypothetical protein GGF32_008224 [Allomyces javanicus]|nr:hypothetical protein GGF32_008224 [Allomyces javanicus]
MAMTILTVALVILALVSAIQLAYAVTTLPIALILPLSDAALGPGFRAVRNVTHLALPSMNALDSRYNFAFVTQDSGHTRSGTIAAMVKAVTQSNAVGMIGEYSSSITIPLSLAGAQYQMWHCAPSSSSDLSNKVEFPRYLRAWPPDPQQGLRMATLALAMGWRSVNVVYGTDSYGQSIGNAFLASAAQLGITVETSLVFQPGTKDMSAIGAALKASASNIVVFQAFAGDSVTLLREARKQGIIGDHYAWLSSESVALYFTALDPSDPVQYAQDVSNAQGLHYIFAQHSANNAEYAALQARYAAAYGPGTDVASLAMATHYYDCALAMARGLIQLANQYGTAALFAHNTNATLQEFLAGASGFDGVTGWFVTDSIGDRLGDFDVYYFDGTAARLTSTIYTNGTVNTINPPKFYSGSSTPPLDRPAKALAYPTWSDAGVIVLAVIRAILLGLVAAAIGYLYLKRDVKVVKNLSFPFLAIIAFGCIVVLASEFLIVGTPVGQWACHGPGWILAIGFELVMAGLAVKTYRVWSIFDNKYLSVSKRIDNTYLMGVVAVAVLVQSIIFAVWVGTFPMAPRVVPNKQYLLYECAPTTVSGKAALPVLLGVSLGYNGLLLLIVAYFGYKTRNVMSAFRETVWILYSAQNVVLASVVAIPCALMMVADWGLGTYYVRAAMVLYAVTFVFYALVGRVAWTLLGTNGNGGPDGGGKSMAVSMMASAIKTFKPDFNPGKGSMGTEATLGISAKAESSGAVTATLDRESGKVMHLHGVYPVKRTAGTWFPTAWQMHAMHLHVREGLLTLVPEGSGAVAPDRGTSMRVKHVQYDPEPPTAMNALEVFYTGAGGGAWLVQFATADERDAWSKALAGVSVKSTTSKSGTRGNPSKHGRTASQEGSGSGSASAEQQGSNTGQAMPATRRSAAGAARD